MTKSRLEAFSDGVIAIIITIMVLELRPPEGVELGDLGHLAPTFAIYALSFALLGTYWANHHHLFHTARVVNGVVLWANMHLLFWLSLVPFGTAWVGDSGFAPVPVATYGVLMLLAAVAYYGLVRALIACPGQPRTLAELVDTDVKGKISPVLFAAAIPIALLLPWLSIAIYVGVAVLWVVPDRRIEAAVRAGERGQEA